MDLDLIIELLENPTEEIIEALYEDKDSLFWVDWREEDDAIVEYCEDIIQTGELSAKLIEVDNDNGFEIYIIYKNNETKVPLTYSMEDRHITIYTLNQSLFPDYEIRFWKGSTGADTLAFLPLSPDKWRELEDKYGAELFNQFYKIKKKPNVFTDDLPF